MKKQIPCGEEHLNCHRCFPARVPRSDVCHTCGLWKCLRGVDPNTGVDIDHWDCVDAWILTGQLDMAHAARSGAAATESLRNQADEQFRQSVQVAARLARMGPPPAQQIGNGQAPFIIEGDAGSSTRHQGLIPQGEHHET